MDSILTHTLTSAGSANPKASQSQNQGTHTHDTLRSADQGECGAKMALPGQEELLSVVNDQAGTDSPQEEKPDRPKQQMKGTKGNAQSFTVHVLTTIKFSGATFDLSSLWCLCLQRLSPWR